MRKRRTKQLLAYLLTILLAVTMMPTLSAVAFADETEPVVEQQTDEGTDQIPIVDSLLKPEAQVKESTTAGQDINNETDISQKQGSDKVRKSVRASTEPTWGGTEQVNSAAGLQAAIDGATGSAEIQLTQDITLNGTQISIPDSKIIKLTSAGTNQFKIDADKKSRVIQNDGTLYLDNVVITGGYTNHQGGGVWNRSSATLVMNGGTITGNTLTDSYVSTPSYASGGGGVYNEGTFILSGGRITENMAVNGGGVHNYGVNSVFTMTGGEISKHTVEANGGGLYNSGGTITMGGGKIFGNETKGASSGGGVWNGLVNNSTNQNEPGSFTMTGGEIFENSTLGAGGGVHSFAAPFTMTGGEISKNTAMTGGGVGGLYGAKITMKGGKIFNNSAERGAGIELYSQSGNNLNTSFEMTGGEIFHNQASYGGGGLWNFGRFTMDGGKIYGNTAGQDGGGIHQGATTCTILIKKGEITDNKAGRNGGGIMLTRFDSTTSDQLAKIDVLEGGVFAKNSAATAHNILPEDVSLHDAHILTKSYTSPFKYAYNNYDIAYKGIESLIVKFDGNGGTVLPENRERLVAVDQSLGDDMPSSPVRSGYNFTGWNVDADGTGAAFDATTTVGASITVYAQWEAEATSQTDEKNEPTQPGGSEEPSNTDKGTDTSKNPKGSDAPQKGPNAPQTGDDSNQEMLIVIAGLATLVLVGIVLSYRREKQNGAVK